MSSVPPVFERGKEMNGQIENIGEYSRPRPGVVYKTTCKCWHPEHDLVVELELEEDMNTISAMFYVNCTLETRWGPGTWLSRFWLRIKNCLRLLFCGKIKMDQEFIFRGEDHINGFCDALRDGINKLSNEKKNN